MLWVGGSVCAGKSSAARFLAERYGLRRYHFDDYEPRHFGQASLGQQPGMAAFLAMSMDERWVLQSPASMADQVLAFWAEERFLMVLEDLLAMRGDGPIVAEGAGLLPAKIAPLLTDPRAAVCLIATPECIRHVRRVRGEGVSLDTSDPARAFENLVARDILMAGHIRGEAMAAGLTIVEVDLETLGSTASLVEQHFAPLLLGPH